MTDVLFTHSYFLKFDPKEFRAMMPYPPLGTLYAAAAVRQAGYSVALFDAMLANTESEIEEHIRRYLPRFVVIYDDDFNYLTKMCLSRMRRAAFAMAEIASRHGCTVIVHGSDATDNIGMYLDHGVGYIVAGEGERTLCELLNVLIGRDPRTPSTVPGVICRDAEGVIRSAPKREVIRDLDTLPLPARDLVDIERYRELWVRRHGYFSLNMVTTRGCPFHCNWCAKPLYGQVYNCHSPRRVAEEMAAIREMYRPDHIWFCDDIFGLKPDWTREFADEVTRLDAKTPFKCLSRADLLADSDAVTALRRAGCTTAWIGAESGAQKILDAMDKGITVKQIHRATTLLQEAGIRVGFFLQFGYPGEHEREIHQTLEMVRTAMPDEIGISVSYPLPGTRFYERVQAEMGAKRNWTESADLAMMFQGAYPTGFYRELAKYVHMDHRMRQGARAIRSFVAGDGLPDQHELRRIALMPYYLLAGSVHRLQMKRLGRMREEAMMIPPLNVGSGSIESTP